MDRVYLGTVLCKERPLYTSVVDPDPVDPLLIDLLDPDPADQLLIGLLHPDPYFFMST
jgi:hypothetical protein